MRIECHSIADFMENLVAIGSVFQNIVYWNYYRRPITNIKYLVVVQASTVADLKEDGQFILEAGEECGEDVKAANGTDAGSNRAESLKKQLADYCASRGLKLLPGHIQP
jgi:hypothetical protein